MSKGMYIKIKKQRIITDHQRKIRANEQNVKPLASLAGMGKEAHIYLGHRIGTFAMNLQSLELASEVLSLLKQSSESLSF